MSENEFANRDYKRGGPWIVFLRFWYYVFWGMLRALLPYSWLPKKSVRGKHVLVTGGGSGIGRLMAIEFARLGARLIIWDLNEQGAKDVANEIKDLTGHEVIVQVVDVSDRDAVYGAAKDVLSKVGAVDILVNNAGIFNGGFMMNVPDEKIEKVLKVNTHSLIWTTKAFLPKMIEQKSGHIVNIASMVGWLGFFKLLDYSTSKFAAYGFSETLEVELNAMGHGQEQDQVYVTTVCPSWIKTPLFGPVFEKSKRIKALAPEYVAKTTVQATLTNQSVLFMPKPYYVFYVLKAILPVRAFRLMMDVIGFEAMYNLDYKH